MESIEKLLTIINELSTYANDCNIIEYLDSLNSDNLKLKNELKELVSEHQLKCDEMTNLKTRFH
jgi:hypothetical protein